MLPPFLKSGTHKYERAKDHQGQSVDGEVLSSFRIGFPLNTTVDKMDHFNYCFIYL